MNRSLSLGGLGLRGAGPDEVTRRAGAQVLWVHATSDLRLAVLCALTRNLQAVRDDLQVIATYDPALVGNVAPADGCFDLMLPLHASGSAQGRQMLQNWKPHLGLWTGGQLGHPMIRQAHDAGTELLVLDADPDGLRARKRFFFTDPIQDGLNRFSKILVHGAEKAELLSRTGLAASRVEHTGPLRLVPDPPACPDDEVSEVSEALAGRPVWLAAFPHPDEFGYIVTAHRNAMRHAHKLLLVILLDQTAEPDHLLALLDGMSLRHVLWQVGDPIEDQTQVLVVRDPEDLGLWYRIAPQCFLGHSLIEGEQGRCPMHAASLGSAILHGASVGAFAHDYQRLGKAGAARLVPDGNLLGSEVARLNAPDLAAKMALAGWDVATEGAALCERMVILLQGRLDAAETRHAST